MASLVPESLEKSVCNSKISIYSRSLMNVYNPKPGDGPTEYSSASSAYMGEAGKVRKMLDSLDEDTMLSADNFIYWAKAEYLAPAIFKFFLVKGLYCTVHLSPMLKYELWCDQVYHVLGRELGRKHIEIELKTTLELATYEDKNAALIRST